jgi:hypothetical protein
MFVAFGVNPATAIVAVLAYRFFAFWLPIAPGAVSYATLRRTISRWEAADAGEEGPAPKTPKRRPRVKHHDRSLCHQYS